MQYRSDRYGNLISTLGFGCMRFTRKGPSIDYDKAEKEVMHAVGLGVNYYDTAYMYPGSEELMGKIFYNNGIREKIYIATKLPQYIVRTKAAIEKTFQKELERLQTDYIDYYLMHMFTDVSEWEHMKALGIEDWIREHKADGSIRQIGFSYHGNTEMFFKILNAYDWDFCQIQYNYLDVDSQAGRRGLEAAEEKGIPVIIMEPLRGGKLVRVPAEAEKLIDNKGMKPAEFGLKWLYDQPGVTCVLSGMNSLEMIDENVKTASETPAGSLTDQDREVYEKVRSIIKSKEKVGCTGCRYCMPCPHGVDIPAAFYYYNLMYIEKKFQAQREYAQVYGIKSDPPYAAKCVGCGKCEKHCPQGIRIIEMLKEADRNLRPPYIRLGTAAARKFMLRGQKKAVSKEKG